MTAKDELREKMKMLFSTPFYFNSYEDLSRFTDSVIEDFDKYAKQKALEILDEVIREVQENHQGTFTDDADHDCWYIDELVNYLQRFKNDRIGREE